MNNYNRHILFTLCFLFVGNICFSQTLGERLRVYVDFLTEEEKLSMSIDIELRDESNELLETSKMEYIKRGKSVSAKLENKLFVFDSERNITLNVDSDAKSMRLEESNNGDLVSTQLRSMIMIFDENEKLFDVSETVKNGQYTYSIEINSEPFAYYAFSKSDKLTEVIFYKMSPQYVDGVKINPIMKMDFDYNVKTAIPKLSKFIHKIGNRWSPHSTYEGFEFYDELSYTSNNN